MEAFATQITAKGLESCVLPTVSDEVGALTKGFSTHLTLVRFLTCMNEGVFLHIRFLVEPLPTVLTGIGPGVRVDKQVGGQSRRSLKTLSTDLTIKAAFL